MEAFSVRNSSCKVNDSRNESSETEYEETFFPLATDCDIVLHVPAD